MKKPILLKRILAMFAVILFFTLSSQLKAQQLVTIGTGTNYNTSTSYPSPYGAYYSQSRIQMIILASELNNAGLSPFSTTFSSLAFNIQGTNSAGPHLSYTIKMKNTTATSVSTTSPAPLGYDNAGLLTVFNPVNFTPTVTGWNTHVFNTPFVWDGSSNILVDVCWDNGNLNWTVNASVYNTTTPFYSILQGLDENSTGLICPVGPGTGVNASNTAYTTRPNMQFNCLSSGPALPPLAGFAYNIFADTAWLNSPFIFVNTSNNTTRSYWDITGYSPTINGTYTAYPASRVCVDRWNTCYIDTIHNNFTYSFPQAGYYKVKLKVANIYYNGTSLVEGMDSITKIIYCALPTKKPVASFFSVNRTVGFADQLYYYDLSLNGPTQWSWWINPGYYGVSTFLNSGAPNTFYSPNSQNPYLFALDGGVFDVCLAAGNAIGWDTLCRSGYLTVNNGYAMCNGSDSVSTLSSGYVYDGGGPTGNYSITSTGSCPAGFRIAACADTVILDIERFKLLPQDSVTIRVGNPSGPIVKRLGGSSLADSLKHYRVPGSFVFIQMSAVNPNAAGDSGFAIHWTIVPATYSKPKASFSVPTTIYAGYTMQYVNTSVGTNMSYSWDTNGDGSFGLDELYISVDETSANPGYKFTTPGSKKVCVKVYNCVGADTACKLITILPLVQKPIADMSVDRVSGFTTDTFRFTDKSLNGANQWLWTFSPNTVAYANGTNSSSQNPVVFLNSATSYTVTLRATNSFGSDTKTIPDMVSVVAYNSPGTQNIIPMGSDIGISRVTLGSIDTTTALQTPVYTPMYNEQKTTLYRGVDYTVRTYRQSNNDPMTTRVWIDYNRNAHFTDTAETIINETRQNKVITSKTFRIPDNSPTGNTRMRVGIGYDITTLTPDYAQIGCFEDYGILIGVDHIPPVITLKGASIVKMELGTSYMDSGAKAVDNLEGDISSKVIRTGYVDTTTVGYYTLTYTVSDLYGNMSIPVTRIVQVEIDQLGPRLTLNGQDTVRVEVFNTYVEQGATAKDNQGHDISNLVTRTGTINTNVLGTYQLTYKVTDAFEFTATKTRTVIVMDTIKPVISSLTAKDTIRYQINTPYTDQVTANDNYWGSLTPTRTGSINVNVIGYYTLLYNVTDPSGNEAIPYRLVVKIDDLVPPVLTLNGDLEMTVDVNTVFVEPGYDYSDNYYPKSSITITKTPAGPVMTTLNTTNMDYMACDPSTNCTVVTRIVHVVDRIAPVITLIGSNPYVLPRYGQYIDQGVTITDNYYTQAQLSSLMVMDVSKVRNDVPGFYYVTFNVTDPSGNMAKQVRRAVMVEDKFLGVNNMNKTQGMKIYPNPANGKFTIELENGTVIQTVKVYNMVGSLIKEQAVKSNDRSIAIDISGVAEGVYIVKMEGEGRSYLQKINIVK